MRRASSSEFGGDGREDNLVREDMEEGVNSEELQLVGEVVQKYLYFGRNISK